MWILRKKLGVLQCGVVHVRAPSMTLRSRGIGANQNNHVGCLLDWPTRQIIRLERGTCHRNLSTGTHLPTIVGVSFWWGYLGIAARL